MIERVLSILNAGGICNMKLKDLEQPSSRCSCDKHQLTRLKIRSSQNGRSPPKGKEGGIRVMCIVAGRVCIGINKRRASC